jgi:AcrR family transcriptional regulator
VASVKKRRPYRSRLRAEQAEQTRLRILEAAEDLFTKHGYIATTIEAVAARARVAVDTVYATFGTKQNLLSALVGLRVTGNTQELDVLEGEGPRAVQNELDPRRQIAMFAADIAQRIERVRPIDDAMRSAAEIDPDIADMRARMQEHRFRSLRTFTGWVSGDGALRPGLDIDHAAATVWALTSPDVNRLLRDGRGWSRQRYATWLADTLVRTLLP